MGMFDYVNVYEDVFCTKCGTRAHGFQTKDGDCALDTLDYRDCYNFYTSCDKCGNWIEFSRDEFYKGRRVPRASGLSDFESNQEVVKADHGESDPYLQTR